MAVPKSQLIAAIPPGQFSVYPVMPRPTLTPGDILQRLHVAAAELEQLAPAPRVEVDREAVLAMVRLSIDAITALSKVH